MKLNMDKLVKILWEPPGGDAPYGWSSESFTVKIGSVSIHTFTNKKLATDLKTELVQSITKFLKDGEEQ